MNLAIVGSTGMVGRTMLQVLAERGIEVENLYPVASKSSLGKKITYGGKSYDVCLLEDAIEKDLDFALFSAGGGLSKEWAPKFAARGVVVIDNSSAWRMEEECPLVVPQINQSSISKDSKIIANPNCSTIQLVMALAPLDAEFKIKRLVISTYQSITGTGKDAVDQMEQERAKGQSDNMVYAYPIDKNCIPHCDIFLENGYTKEEMKLVHETRKILNKPNLPVTATAVRIPVVGGHSESVNVAFENDFEIERVRELLANTEGVSVVDDIDNNIYPMPINAEGKDDVMVGRIRRDESQANTLNMWVVADNLRKGAATNAVEILEKLVQK
ncbi:aspartate-semialdehyde dehydrogenase [Bacteroidia bacterium]|jgi:aspartate-semialdehyde dehydrogenase|nr:aspartate-semialdehyde dehydrogenase [Bacteroidota bacterium]MDA8930073.1 aspartate-semialdehyde dehydrogenase [Bacteroidia bacterium]MDB4173713.1 aspartate-semialdehyde dehydrogenase [Bacteroidia bacterium]